MLGNQLPVYDDDDDRMGIRAVLIALGLALIGLFGLVLVSLSIGESDQLVVVTAPWTQRSELLQMVWQSQGGVAAFGGVPWIGIAMSDAPDFKQRLYRQGAWLVVRSPRFLGCSSQVTENMNDR